ncbi:MAG TPA: GAF domain-containing protein [Pyrinomonadaceae bacterium]|jgi:signal transduction protein with GAF and PtsI domain
MSEENKNGLEKKLQSVIETVDVANALTEPMTVSIENLLKISANAMNSEEASVIVREGDEGDLRFLSAIGKVAERLKNLRIPAGKGIAGFVFSSGQPMAITDVGEEDTFYAEVDKQTGYSTQTILATPLRYNGEVIGVLEYVNRIGEPPYEPFTPKEMDKASLYAEAIAALVNAYEIAKIFKDLGDKMLSGEDNSDFVVVREWLSKLRDSSEHREMMDLAVLVREISNRGEGERAMCREILEAVLRYSKDNSETSYLSF